MVLPLAFGAGFARRPLATAATHLRALSADGAAVLENAAPGTVIATLGRTTAGSTLTLAVTAGGRVVLSGLNLVVGATPIDREAVGGDVLEIAVDEALAGADNTPRRTLFSIPVGNVLDGPSLGALALSSLTPPETAPVGAVVATLSGRTAGSALALANDAGGRFVLDGLNLRVAAGLGAAGSQHGVAVDETLADSPNSPRRSTFTLTVADVTAPTLTSSTSLSAVGGAVRAIPLAWSEGGVAASIAGEEQLGLNIDVLAPPAFNDVMLNGFQAMLAGDKTAEQQAADMQAAWEEGMAEMATPAP